MFELDKALLERARKQFAETSDKPFSYAVLDELLPSNLAMQCSEEFLGVTKDGFVKYSDPDFEYLKSAQNKREQFPTTLGQVFDHLHSEKFVQAIEYITGFDRLKVDENRWGGGLHMTEKEGYLAVHKDFTVLPTTFRSPVQFLRTINIIGYLTPNWTEEWGGQLEFWNPEGTKCVQSIAPLANRWVVFDTRGTYHGHPWPYKGLLPRISMATYYYQELPVSREEWKSTEYLKLPWKEESPQYAEKRRLRSNAEIRYGNLIPER